MPLKLFCFCLLVALTAPFSSADSSAHSSAHPPAQQSSLEARRKSLNDLLAERWEYTMRTNPIYASILGDKRWNDKLDDASQEAIDKDLAETKKFLARIEAVDTTGFPQQEQLNKTLMVRDLKMNLEGARFKPWEMPVSQFGGLHIELPDLVTVLSFETVTVDQHAEDFDSERSRGAARHGA